ncbi:MAG: histidinol-phosphatase HisJ [Treponema sp.]|nr:histidinol-phosphatase HisJ [Treponema sp.]
MKSYKTVFSSMHTHTNFCDGKDDIETMCRAAYNKNLYAVGFSAHSPIEKQLGIKSEWNLKEEKVAKYINEVLAAKERWQSKLKVFLGLEVDYIKNIRSPLDSDIKALNLDYTIGSVHYLVPKDTEPFTVDGSKEEFEKGLNEGYNGNAQSLMSAYYDAVLEMISSGGFDILGHVDLIKKNTHDKNLWLQENEIKRQKEIARAVSKTKIVIEVNTGGINRKKIHDVYPSLSFLKIINKYNIPVIITSDAHCAGDINGNYDNAVQTLALAGINKHFLFNGRINNNSVWQKEIIQ